MNRTLIVALLTAGTSAVLAAQDQQAIQRRSMEVTAQAGAVARAVVETRVTRDKPYSAEAVTEFVQVLGDGNRIVRKSSTRLFRDTEGRTRREELSDSATPQRNNVVITDPVANSSFVLDATARVAYKSPGMFARMVTPQGLPAGGRGRALMTEPRVEVFTVPDAENRRAAEAPAAIARGGTLAAAPTASITVMPPGIGETSKQDLGQQTIEGVTANGTRTTTVIPAGSIGNEQPITIVSEQWFSPDLDVLVLTRHNDPRVGETTYRLINISRAEPERSLFQVPSDYTIQDRAPALMRQRQQ